MKIGPRGAQILSRGLMKNHHLMFLFLENNCLEDVGTKAISFSLKYNNTIKEIDFSKII